MANGSINILSSALQTYKKRTEVSMQNVANADTENYSNKITEVAALSSGNSPQGVKIVDIKNKSDAMLVQRIMDSNSETVMYERMSDDYKKIQDLLATPGSTDGLVGKISQFFTSIGTLSLNSYNGSFRNDMVQKSEDIATYISKTADFIQEKRYEADQEIAKSIVEINNILDQLFQVNMKKLTLQKGTLELCQAEDIMNDNLKKLSYYFSISTYTGDDGMLHIMTKNNGQEILGKQRYSFEYAPAHGKKDFINENELNPIYLVSQTIGGKSTEKTVFVSGGNSDDVIYNLSGGLISALLQMRDVELPNVAATIDVLAVKFAQEVNKIHNKGNGAEARGNLQGTKLTSLNDKILGNGHILINPIQKDGTPVVGPNGDKMPAMNLDLSKFTTNGILGSFTTQGLIDEINSYFKTEASANRVNVNGFHNIQLASRSANGLTLDFDLMSYTEEAGVENMNFVIDSVNGATLLGPTSYTINNGANGRTGANGGPTIQLSSIPIGGTTVTVNFHTVVNGVIKNATAKYNIAAPGAYNKRFDAITAFGDATILNTGLGISPVTASLVNDGMQLISDPNEQGFLRLDTSAFCSGVIIDELNSIVTAPENRVIDDGGFSYAFGMNDLFVLKNQANFHIKNVANFLDIDDEVKNAHNLFSVGKMQPYKAGIINRDAPDFFYSMGVGDTSLVKEYQDLREKNLTFKKTRNLGDKISNLFEYAMEIVSVNNIKTIHLDVKTQHSEELLDGLKTQLSGETGVSIDTEMTAAIQYQNIYMSAAKGITIFREMFRELLNAF